jgi:tetratricopeptide (TPR) repeat protein
MLIDGRRDHFFRRPDPLQAKAAGAPDVCTGCHTTKSQEWAAQTIAGWSRQSDNSWQDRQPFIAFDADDKQPSTLAGLLAYARDLDRPAIVRATALDRLSGVYAPSDASSLEPLIKDESELVRLAAAKLIGSSKESALISGLERLLRDPVRTVRHAAALALADSTPDELGPENQKIISEVLDDYRQARLATADMPESQMSLGGLALSQRQWDKAEAHFLEAATLDPQLEDAWITLTRLRSAFGDIRGAETLVKSGLELNPNSIPLQLESAALAIRKGDQRAGLDILERIAKENTSSVEARLQLASVALTSGNILLAQKAAQEAILLAPQNVDAYLLAAAAYYAGGNRVEAKRYAQLAININPETKLPPELATLLNEP